MKTGIRLTLQGTEITWRFPWAKQPNPARYSSAYDHYRAFGQRQTPGKCILPGSRFVRKPPAFVVEDVNECSVRTECESTLSSMAHACPMPQCTVDAPIKLPGMTHPAFIVDDLEAWWPAETSRASPSPMSHQSPKKNSLFIQRSDGNVLEFNNWLMEVQ